MLKAGKHNNASQIKQNFNPSPISKPITTELITLKDNTSQINFPTTTELKK